MGKFLQFILVAALLAPFVSQAQSVNVTNADDPYTQLLLNEALYRQAYGAPAKPASVPQQQVQIVRTGRAAGYSTALNRPAEPALSLSTVRPLPQPLRTPRRARTSGFSLLPAFSTIGAGLEGGYTFNDRWALRFDTFYGGDSEQASPFETETLNLQSHGMMLTRLFGDFFISGGVRYNQNSSQKRLLTPSSASTDCLELDGACYQDSQFTSASVTRTFDAVSPQLSFGYSRGFGRKQNLRVLLELGAFLQRPGSEAFAIEGVNPMFGATVAHEVEEALALQGSSFDRRIWPLAKIAIGFRF